MRREPKLEVSAGTMVVDLAVTGSEASAQCLLRYTHRRTFLSTQVRDAAGVVAERVETADET